MFFDNKEPGLSLVKCHFSPNALSKKFAKFFGCPGGNGCRMERSMFFRVSVRLLNKHNNPLLMVFSFFKAGLRGRRTCRSSTAGGGPCTAAWPAPAGGCPSVCRWPQPAEVCRHREPPGSFLLLRGNEKQLLIKRITMRIKSALFIVIFFNFQSRKTNNLCIRTQISGSHFTLNSYYIGFCVQYKLNMDLSSFVLSGCSCKSCALLH